jgi:cell wall-associated NlpC family hydrolase
MFVFQRLGRSLLHNSEPQDDAAGVRHVSREQLAPGDLVFTIRDGRIGPLGINAGSKVMWAATQSGDVVRQQSLSGRELVFGRVR